MGLYTGFKAIWIEIEDVFIFYEIGNESLDFDLDPQIFRL